MRIDAYRLYSAKPTICLRCLLRSTTRSRRLAFEAINKSPVRNAATAAAPLFRRDYFSANKRCFPLSPDIIPQRFKLHPSQDKGSTETGTTILCNVEPEAGGTTISSTGNALAAELPHRRRKRLKAEVREPGILKDAIPPDASSRLSSLSTTLPQSSLRRQLSLYLSLSKPRLSFLIVLTTAAAYSLYPVPALLLPEVTASPSLSALTLVFLTSGTAFCSASANALNMLMEPQHDAKMSRTRNRPIVRGYVGKKGAALFAILAGTAGMGALYLGVNPTVAFLGGLNIFLYAGVYTPLKRISTLNTWVGAVVGGIPPLMGWAAAAGQTATGVGDWKELLLSEESIGGWLLASFLYAWQFPHFNALSWTIREEYKHAGYRMLAWVNPQMNGRVAFRYAMLSFPICGALWWFGITDQGFLITSSIVNTWIVREAWLFWRRNGYKGSARGLFWAGVWHLPVVMVLAMAHKKGLWEGVWQRINGGSMEEKLWNSSDEDEEESFSADETLEGPVRPLTPATS
ncbi:MAG: hypothetical protein Q9183_002094 [Haloplaca sp. 2 TL-2023]